MNRFSSVVVAAAAAGAALLVSPLALADIAPMCSQFDMTTSCDQTEVEKPCSIGGTCKAVSCDAGMTLYKCILCPTKIEDPAGVCKDLGAFGMACGEGGECTKTAAYCGNGDFGCYKQGSVGGAGGAGGSAGNQGGGAAGEGTAGSGTAGAGTAGSGTAGSGTAGSGAAGAGAAGAETSGGAAEPASDDSGCSVSPRGKRGAMAALVTMLGAAALLVDRRRRRS